MGIHINSKKISLLFTGMTILSSLLSAQVGKLYPVDEAQKDPSFFTFRSNLFRALADHDTTFLYTHLSLKILNSFGGDGGIEEFKQTWNLNKPNSRLWSTMARVLGSGGIFLRIKETGGDSSTIFWAPYYSSCFPKTFDSYNYGAVIGENVRVRLEPNLSSQIINILSFDIVEIPPIVTGPGVILPPQGWEKIKLNDGRIGYILKEYSGRAISYRISFVKENKKWVIRSFVAGD